MKSLIVDNDANDNEDADEDEDEARLEAETKAICDNLNEMWYYVFCIDVRSFLGVIAQVMNGTEKSPQVYLAATRALNNILKAASLFKYAENRCTALQRSVLAKVICEATLVDDPHIRNSAMECFR
ncbi:hypothetical protein POM88_052747 [Heracleum sosnowskyi]|uniref:Uncharacterized protein n=1 Tax=Heracleum sosnowskyi TaxID=360622 RepID=A0AAD8LYJ6_9APIA|nr:hypothetical protein POM88_052747 [Heracleum sosnowskyi]